MDPRLEPEHAGGLVVVSTTWSNAFSHFLFSCTPFKAVEGSGWGKGEGSITGKLVKL